MACYQPDTDSKHDRNCQPVSLFQGYVTNFKIINSTLFTFSSIDICKCTLEVSVQEKVQDDGEYHM